MNDRRRRQQCTIFARAPLRISFGGGGTDLDTYYIRHGGFVVSGAITRYCHVVARDPGDGSFRLASANYHTSETFAAGRIPPIADPLALAKAAIDMFGADGISDTGVELLLASDVPPGTGLGGSSSMAVALARALATYVGLSIVPSEVAERACILEIDRLGMPIGRQDQFASAFGGLNAFEFTADGTVTRRLPLNGEAIAALHARLLLFSTGDSRKSSDILCEQRARSKSDERVVESLHQIKFLARDIEQALVAGDLDKFGSLLDSGWRLKKKLSGQITTEAIDGYYAAARNAGALGGKITGAGGGGHLLLCCADGRRDDVRNAMQASGLRALAFDFDLAGATVETAGKGEPLRGSGGNFDFRRATYKAHESSANTSRKLSG